MTRRIGRLCAATAGSIVIGCIVFDTVERRRLDKKRAALRAHRAELAVINAHHDGAR